MFIPITFPYLFFIDVRERAKRDLERGKKPENRSLGYHARASRFFLVTKHKGRGRCLMIAHGPISFVVNYNSETFLPEKGHSMAVGVCTNGA
jgi:hypothetical protein